MDHRLIVKFFGIIERREGMSVGFGQKLYTAGFGQIPEGVQNLRRIGLQLFQSSTGNRKCYSKLRMFGNDFLQKQIGRQIALLCDPSHDFFIAEVVVVVMVVPDVEKTVSFQTKGLMYLEV